MIRIPQNKTQNRFKLTIGLGKGRGIEESCRIFGFNNNKLFKDFLNSSITYFQDNVDNILYVKARHSDLNWMLENNHVDIAVASSVWFTDKDKFKAYDFNDKIAKPCRLSLISKEPLLLRNGLTVATKFIDIAKAYFDKKKIEVKLIPMEGCHENALLLNFADAIIDIIETGATIKRMKLIELEALQLVSHKLYIKNEDDANAIYYRLNEYLISKS